MQDTRIEISLKTIVTILLVISGIYLGLQVLDIIVQLMLAFVLMTALNPAVVNIQKLHVSRFFAALWIYFLIIGLLVLSMVLVVPPLVEQTASLLAQFDLPNLPFVNDLKHLQFSVSDVSSLWRQYGTSVTGLVSFLTSTFSIVFSFFTVMVMTLYFLLEREHIHRYAEFVFQSGDKAERSKKMFAHIETALGSWVRGEALLMFTIGLMTYAGLTIMGVPYAIPLAIVAGLLEALPNLGPTIASVPAVIVSLVAVSPLMALFTALLYWAIQALENNFIVPFVMKKTVGINPLTSIVLILIGFRFGGVLGALLIIPYYIVVRVIAKEFAPEIEKIFH